MADPVSKTHSIAAIAPIGGIGPLLPIAAFPRIAFPVAAATGFRLDSLPADVQLLFAKGPSSWLDALDEAIRLGFKDPRSLADMIFFMHHAERMKGGVGRLIDPNDDEFIRLRVEWNHYRTIADGRLDPSAVPGVFLPEQRSDDYEKFVARQTTGRITLMINGRNRHEPDAVDDQVEAFDSMQKTLESLGPGNSVYLATWQLKPQFVPLTLPRPGMAYWNDLLKKKAMDGVKIRLIIAIHPDLADGVNSDLGYLDGLIKELPGRRARTSNTSRAGIRHDYDYAD